MDKKEFLEVCGKQTLFGSLKQSCRLHGFNRERCGCFVVSGCVAQVRAENVNRVNCCLDSVGKRSGFEVRWRPVLSIERGDPEVSTVQASERRGTGEERRGERERLAT